MELAELYPYCYNHISKKVADHIIMKLMVFFHNI